MKMVMMGRAQRSEYLFLHETFPLIFNLGVLCFSGDGVVVFVYSIPQAVMSAASL